MQWIIGILDTLFHLQLKVSEMFVHLLDAIFFKVRLRNN